MFQNSLKIALILLSMICTSVSSSESPELPDKNGVPLVVVATGQSNMLGHTQTSGLRDTINPYVAHYEQFPKLELGQTKGWKSVGPNDPDWAFASTGNNLAYHFCDLLQRKTKRQVLLIFHAAGGQRIAQWMPNGGGYSGVSGHMYFNLNRTLASARAAAIPNRTDGKSLNDLNIEGADVLLFHQGESNQDSAGISTGPQYKARLKRVIEIFRDPGTANSSAKPFINSWTPVVLGELYQDASNPRGSSDRNTELREIAREDDLIGLAKSSGLKADDALHFNGEYLVEFARRYFNAYNQL